MTDLLVKIEGFAGKGHMVGGVLTVADLWTYWFLNFLRCGFWDGVPTDYLAAYPKLTAFVDRIAAREKIAAYLASSKHLAAPAPLA